MLEIQLPHADFFDEVVPLDGDLEKSASLLFPASSLSASLPGMLMWRDRYAYGLARKDGAWHFLALAHGAVYAPAPPKPFTRQALSQLMDYLARANGPGPGISRVEGLTEDQAADSRQWGWACREGGLEYMYERERIAGLQGDPYRSQRAEVNHLLKDEAVLFRPYRASDLAACGDLFELWKKRGLEKLKGSPGEKMLLSAQGAHFQALKNAEDWGMNGWVVLLGKRLAAYSLGAALDRDSYGIFLEVADLTVKGLSAYIFANTCRMAEGFQWVNAGDAEYLPGLSEAKEHWHPVRRSKTHIAEPK